MQAVQRSCGTSRYKQTKLWWLTNLVHTNVDSIEVGGVKMSESVNGVKVMGVVYTNKPDSMTAT